MSILMFVALAPPRLGGVLLIVCSNGKILSNDEIPKNVFLLTKFN